MDRGFSFLIYLLMYLRRRKGMGRGEGEKVEGKVGEQAHVNELVRTQVSGWVPKCCNGPQARAS